jgi:D-alanine-D-alanine ligase
MLGIAYSGSDPLTLAATLDKDCAKRLVAANGIATPRWTLFVGDLAAIDDELDRLAFPVFVKPAYEGSSKGILDSGLIDNRAQLDRALTRLHAAYTQPILVEEFIDGDELTVGLVGNEPPAVIGVMRVLPTQQSDSPFIYSLEMKRDWRKRVRYECPAQLSEGDTQAVEQAALAAWRALGCRDVSRFDFRLRDGVPYFLEVNPLPGLSPTSGDLVILSAAVGVEHPELMRRIIEAACTRHGLSAAPALAAMID